MIMTRQMRQIVLMVALFVALAIVVLQGAFSAETAPSAVETRGFLAEYTLRADGSPLHLSAETDKRVWFTMPDANVVGVIEIGATVLDYDVTYYNVPTPNSEPHNLAVADGVVWFTEKAGNKLGRLDIVSETFTEFPLPTNDTQPTGIDVDSDTGMVWIAGSANDLVVGFDSADSTFNEYQFSGTGAQFERLKLARNGHLWLTAPARKEIVEFEPARERFATVGVIFQPFFGGQSIPLEPSGLAVTRASTPWVTAPSNNLIGLYSPGTLSLWNWIEPINESIGLSGIDYKSIGGSDYLWYAGRDANSIGRLVRTGNTTDLHYEFPLITANSQPHDVLVGDDLNVWVSQPNTNRISLWQAPYVNTYYAPALFNQ